jgi:hypothetical protein
LRATIATVIWMGTIALCAAGLVLIAVSFDADLPDSWGFRGFTAVFGPTFATVGMLIVRRHDRHAVGWILLAAGTLSAVQLVAEEYLIASRVTWPGLPLGTWVGWLNAWIWVPVVVLVSVGAVLYFPDGRLASPAWRPMLPLAALSTIATITGAMFSIDQLRQNMHGFPPPYDPYAFPAFTAIAPLFIVGGFALNGLLTVGAVASVARRFRRARGVERQQIKWFAYAATVLGAAVLVNAMVQAQFLGTPQGQIVVDPIYKLPQVFLILAMALLPCSIGIAILRYRLYDVDLFINGSIVYASVSTILGVTYLAAVVSLQALLRPLTTGSELAVAASTLLVVGLFQPIRARVQDAVDRRFYRAKYNAARTLDAFAARLREEIDLGALEHEVLAVVDGTVRPTRSWLWLRGRM